MSAFLNLNFSCYQSAAFLPQDSEVTLLSRLQEGMSLSFKKKNTY